MQVLQLLHRRSHSICLMLLVLFGFACCRCQTKPEAEKPYDWAHAPTIRFVTEDWKYTKSLFIAGDSLSIGFVDFMRGVDTMPSGRNRIANIISASGDTEKVDITSRWIGIFIIPIYVEGGARLATQVSSDILTGNNILDITTSVENIKVIYHQSITKTNLSLSDEAIVIIMH